MVSKLDIDDDGLPFCFRAVLFRMVSKRRIWKYIEDVSFRAVLFRMVSKPYRTIIYVRCGFRAVLFRMVSKLL